MPKSSSLLFLAIASAFLSSSLATSKPTAIEQFDMAFFAEHISISYAPKMKIAVDDTQLDERILTKSYNELKTRNISVLLNSLLKAKQQYQLNDFLFYQLARRSMGIIYNGRSMVARELSLFHLLAEAGFDARLTYKNRRAFVNVYTEDELFEVPIIVDGRRPYANISCMNGECNGKQRLFIFRQQPNPQGKSFSFQLPEWPKLKAQPVVKPLQFSYRGINQTLEVTFDKTMVDIMKDYPFIHEYAYLETPLSPTLRSSLLPKFRTLLNGLDQQEQLELLVSFTRSAFAYKEDNEYFGRSKPMVPEELFSYAYSDCEDRSALFFALVRELLDISMVVIAYEDHLSIAVESDTISGDFFHYEGRRFIFCDPTGPRGSSRIGQVPPGYENKSFEIIGQYK